jgi:hypothetical protein
MLMTWLFAVARQRGGLMSRRRSADSIKDERQPRPGTRARSAHAPVAAPVPPFPRRAAADPRTLFTLANRLFWLKAATLLSCCIGLAMSPRLWIGPRTFPSAPAIASLPQIDGVLAHALFAALVVLAAASVVATKPRWLIAAFLAIVAAFCAGDQTRWQPWLFLYGFLLAALALYSWDDGDTEGRQSTLNIARLIVAGTYLFSGLQKINLNFIDIDFPWIVSPITGVLPSTAGPLHVFAAIVPFVQIAFAIGLLTNRFRRISLAVAVAMHLFILAMFGPFGLDWNEIIWPWTAVMAVFDVLLFADAEPYSLGDLLWTRGRPYHTLVLILFIGLPALSFFNLWDSYLSAALYSGNLTEGTIYLSDAGRAALPAPLAEYLVHTSENTNVLNIQRWAIEDLGVTPYPETRVYRAVARQVCGQLGDRSQLVLMVREQRAFRSRPETAYGCGDL